MTQPQPSTKPTEPCAGCKYELDHEGKKVCRTMTRKHGQGCDAYKEADK